jgi:aconitate hydratase
VTSPEVVTAFAYSGLLHLDPITDSLAIERPAKRFQFTAPTNVELAVQFAVGEDFYQTPIHNADDVVVNIDPLSKRLQLLEPFRPGSPGSMQDMPILVKVKGTDHISPAGP